MTAHMRPGDVEEVMCQLPEGTKRHEIAYMLLHGGDCFVAELDGKPVMAFGTMPLNVAALSVWALGTKDTWRVVSAVTRFMQEEYIPKKVEQGYRMMEARSIRTHHEAHSWMKGTGAVEQEGEYEYGRNGEKFLTFRWDRTANYGTRRKGDK